MKQPLNFHQAMTCNPRSARSPAANAAAALQLGCILLGLTGGPAAAGEVFYAIASSSLSFGSVSASAVGYSAMGQSGPDIGS